MLAMCVRKTGDTGGNPTLQTSMTTSNSTVPTSKRTKPRGLKTLRSRVVAAVGKQQVQPDEVASPSLRHTSTAHVEVECMVKVRDDPEGHLVYHKGDVVDSRCKLDTVLIECDYKLRCL